MRYLLKKDGTPWRDEKGNKIPYTCPKCGARVGVFIKGEPVFLCTGEIQHYLGTVKFESSVGQSDSDSLAHYGIKGMRWGIRKDRKRKTYAGTNSDGSSQKPNNRDYAGAVRKASEISGHARTIYGEGMRRSQSRHNASSRKRALNEAHAMSDSELKRSLARLQNESNYVRLSTEAESIRNGEDAVNRRLDNIGSAIIISGAGLSAVAAGVELYQKLRK